MTTATLKKKNIVISWPNRQQWFSVSGKLSGNTYQELFKRLHSLALISLLEIYPKEITRDMVKDTWIRMHTTIDKIIP